jgi:hypothetical protein
MLKLDEVNETIKELEATDKRLYKLPDLNKRKKRLLLLRKIKLYLESNLNESFIREEIKRLTYVVNEKTKRFPYWLSQFSHSKELTEKQTKKYKTIFDSDNEIKLMKQQLIFLKFIFEDKIKPINDEKKQSTKH